eukprot:TRINITY_DN3819_c2_g1_i1.p1 TRINITY_DN3819_c2_g1~~TRINITY_DN3819_c2_g1_i1.p1  ORF type:complete len:124 (+),score=11.85 TRINITY_DN3819_c2_g1_i1:62-433(+)
MELVKDLGWSALISKGMSTRIYDATTLIPIVVIICSATTILRIGVLEFDIDGHRGPGMQRRHYRNLEEVDIYIEFDHRHHMCRTLIEALSKVGSGRTLPRKEPLRGTLCISFNSARFCVLVFF